MTIHFFVVWSHAPLRAVLVDHEMWRQSDSFLVVFNDPQGNIALVKPLSRTNRDGMVQVVSIFNQSWLCNNCFHCNLFHFCLAPGLVFFFLLASSTKNIIAICFHGASNRINVQSKCLACGLMCFDAPLLADCRSCFFCRLIKCKRPWCSAPILFKTSIALQQKMANCYPSKVEPNSFEQAQSQRGELHYCMLCALHGLEIKQKPYFMTVFWLI